MRLRHHLVEIEDLYRRHGASLLLFATSMIGDRARAQDVVHQLFLKFIEDRSLGRATNKKAYLFGSVRNAVLNESKRAQRSESLDPDSAWFEAPSRDYAAEIALRCGLATLPEGQRQAVVLHVWCGFTFSEIADLLELSPDTVASRYRYALGKLRDAMGAKEDHCAKS